MSETLPNQPLPPLTINYLDGSVFMARKPQTPELAERNYNVCRQALKLGATVIDAIPIHVGGVERVQMLKLTASEQRNPMQHTKSDGKYGIMK